MATKRDNRKYRARRDAVKAKAKELDSPCHLCGRPIQWDADWRDPMAFTADHIEAVGAGGNMMGRLLPAHRQPEDATHAEARKTSTPIWTRDHGASTTPT